MKTGAQIASKLRSIYHYHRTVHNSPPHNFCLSSEEADTLFSHLRRIRKNPCSYMGVHIWIRDE